jgi:hypothetical protein
METINFDDMKKEMKELERVYMMFGEEPFSFREAAAISKFNGSLIKFCNKQQWLERIPQEDGSIFWKLTFIGARMVEIYIEYKKEAEEKHERYINKKLNTEIKKAKIQF